MSIQRDTRYDESSEDQIAARPPEMTSPVKAAVQRHSAMSTASADEHEGEFDEEEEVIVPLSNLQIGTVHSAAASENDTDDEADEADEADGEGEEEGEGEDEGDVSSTMSEIESAGEDIEQWCDTEALNEESEEEEEEEKEEEEEGAEGDTVSDSDVFSAEGVYSEDSESSGSDSDSEIRTLNDLENELFEDEAFMNSLFEDFSSQLEGMDTEDLNGKKADKVIGIFKKSNKGKIIKAINFRINVLKILKKDAPKRNRIKNALGFINPFKRDVKKEAKRLTKRDKNYYQEQINKLKGLLSDVKDKKAKTFKEKPIEELNKMAERKGLGGDYFSVTDNGDIKLKGLDKEKEDEVSLFSSPYEDLKPVSTPKRVIKFGYLDEDDEADDEVEADDEADSDSIILAKAEKEESTLSIFRSGHKHKSDSASSDSESASASSSSSSASSSSSSSKKEKKKQQKQQEEGSEETSEGENEMVSLSEKAWRNGSWFKDDVRNVIASVAFSINLCENPQKMARMLSRSMCAAFHDVAMHHSDSTSAQKIRTVFNFCTKGIANKMESRGEPKSYSVRKCLDSVVSSSAATGRVVPSLSRGMRMASSKFSHTSRGVGEKVPHVDALAEGADLLKVSAVLKASLMALEASGAQDECRRLVKGTKAFLDSACSECKDDCDVVECKENTEKRALSRFDAL